MLFLIGGVGYVQIGSINGTEQSFKANREVGIIIRSDQVYQYLADLFWGDWRYEVFAPVVFQDYKGPADQVLISEFLPDPFGAADHAEFIELVNPTGTPIELSNMSISDAIRRDEFADLRRFPPNTSTSGRECRFAWQRCDCHRVPQAFLS